VVKPEHGGEPVEYKVEAGPPSFVLQYPPICRSVPDAGVPRDAGRPIDAGKRCVAGTWVRLAGNQVVFTKEQRKAVDERCASPPENAEEQWPIVVDDIHTHCKCTAWN
jgi:hypothetical protein